MKSASAVPPEVAARYREALAFYRTTDWPVARICAHCRVSPCGFRTYLYKYHRDAVLARRGVSASAEELRSVKLRGRSGQTPMAHAKYREAILACDDEEHLALNISQIARLFGLNPSALANQLRAHYPEIVARREQERRRRGLNDNQQRGARPRCLERYAAAVERLRTTDATIGEAAAACHVSEAGLREHVLFYHKDLVRHRADRREQGKCLKRLGAMTGNGNRHEPQAAFTQKYREAVRLYATTTLTRRQIALRTGVSFAGFCNHLYKWHPDLKRPPKSSK